MIKLVVINLINKLRTNKILQYPKKFILDRFTNANICLVFYNDEDRAKVFNLIRSIKKETEMVLRFNEAYQIFMAVKSTNKLGGHIAEIGTFRGGSAKLISEAKGDKHLYLFDTFEGLPEISRSDSQDHFKKGDYSASYEEVKDYLKSYKNVNIYKGLFPQNSEPIINKIFSFVHLDLDLYESTLESIKFFYPRLTKGGIMISHDYIDTLGVRKAFDEFFADKPEPVIEMSGSQCLIVKV